MKPNPFDPWDHGDRVIAECYRVICQHGRLLVACPIARCRQEGITLILSTAHVPKPKTIYDLLDDVPFRRIKSLSAQTHKDNEL